MAWTEKLSKPGPLGTRWCCRACTSLFSTWVFGLTRKITTSSLRIMKSYEITHFIGKVLFEDVWSTAWCIAWSAQTNPRRIDVLCRSRWRFGFAPLLGNKSTGPMESTNWWPAMTCSIGFGSSFCCSTVDGSTIWLHSPRWYGINLNNRLEELRKFTASSLMHCLDPWVQKCSVLNQQTVLAVSLVQLHLVTIPLCLPCNNASNMLTFDII